MKLLVFAHQPPPHHGQSYMVKQMLDGFGGDRRKGTGASAASPFGIECYHVNARFSKTLEDVGEFQGTKLLLIIFYCLQAIWCRFRYGVENFYYVPAPGKKVAVYRDWLVMLLCRPFFKRVILHWHAAGLAKWLETSVQIRTRSITYRLFRPIDLSIVLSKFNRPDAEKLLSKHIQVVPNGITDDCPEFESKISVIRQTRMQEINRLIGASAAAPASADVPIVKILFLAHCMVEKGLIDALEGTRIAAEHLRQMGAPVRLSLQIAGEFPSSHEQADFHQRLENLRSEKNIQLEVRYLGFVSGEAKRRAFIESDLFCFPTYYHAESFGLVLIEAMMYGLPIVTTRWRSIPELLPANYPGLVDVQSPAQIAAAIMHFLKTKHDWPDKLRRIYLDRYTLKQHFVQLAGAIHSTE